jgi:hypothetical protein
LELAGPLGTRNGRILLYDVNGNEKVRLHSSSNSYFNGGNVGIGTTVPQSKLIVTFNNGVSGPPKTAITADAPGITASDYSLFLRAKSGEGTVNNLTHIA